MRKKEAVEEIFILSAPDKYDRRKRPVFLEKVPFRLRAAPSYASTRTYPISSYARAMRSALSCDKSYRAACVTALSAIFLRTS
eukprot:267905-Rhodomonas_salina.2